MNTFALSLFFLSPLISYATYILLQENRDPLRGFHDGFLKNSRNNPLESDRLNTLNSSESKVLGRNIPGSKVLFYLFLRLMIIHFFIFNMCKFSINSRTIFVESKNLLVSLPHRRKIVS